MTFPEAIRSVLSQYATFSGRARRSEYWFFYLFTVLVNVGTSILDSALQRTAGGNEIGVVGALASLALFLPSLAVTVRRLHDTGRRGWWLLLPLAPVLLMLFGVLRLALGDFSGDAAGVGLLVLLGVVLTFGAAITILVFLCLDSTPGPNRFGPPPKPPAVGGYGYGGYQPWPPAQGPYGHDPYGPGPYGQGPYAQGPYAQGPYAPGPHAQDPDGQGAYGQGAYGQGPHAQGPSNDAPPHAGHQQRDVGPW